MADNLDEVFAEPLEAVEPVPVQEEIAQEPVPEPVEQPAPEPSQPQAGQPQHGGPGYVPIDAMLTERERRQTVERELQQLRAQHTRPQEVPDPYDDPAGYQSHVNQQVNAGLQAQKANMSYALAVRDYGKDDVEAARAWALEKAQKDPVFGQQVETAFQSEMLPVDWVVQQHKRDALLTDIGDPSRLDDWFEREATKRGFAKQSAPAPVAQAAIPQQASPPVKVPRSLASQGSAPSDLRHTATGALSGVDALFN